jgi:hypothetical protein
LRAGAGAASGPASGGHASRPIRAGSTLRRLGRLSAFPLAQRPLWRGVVACEHIFSVHADDPHSAEDGEGPVTGLPRPSRLSRAMRRGSCLHALHVSVHTAGEPVKGPSIRRRRHLPCGPPLQPACESRIRVGAGHAVKAISAASSSAFLRSARPMTCVGIRVFGHRRAPRRRTQQ